MAKPHVVIVEGQVFQRALFLVNELLLMLLGFNETVICFFKVFNIEIAETQVILSCCLRMTQLLCFSQTIYRLCIGSNSSLDNTEIKKSLMFHHTSLLIILRLNLISLLKIIYSLPKVIIITNIFIDIISSNSYTCVYS